MRGRVVAVMVVAAFTAFAAAAIWSGRTAAQSPFGDPNAEPAPFNPQMAALMSMLIQPRHTKLGLAGKAENWPLAGYMLKELRQGFAVVSKAVPRFKGLPVPDLVDAAVTQPITLSSSSRCRTYRRSPIKNSRRSDRRRCRPRPAMPDLDAAGRHGVTIHACHHRGTALLLRL